MIFSHSSIVAAFNKLQRAGLFQVAACILFLAAGDVRAQQNAAVTVVVSDRPEGMTPAVLG